MSEWRTLPEFPDYEITSDGDVRNRWSHRKLKETQNKNTGAWSYSLRRKDKTSTQRAFWGLIYSAWPELEPVVEPKPEKVYSIVGVTKGQYRDIPGFPKYEVHPTGRVRYKLTRQPRKAQVGHPDHIILYNEEGPHRKSYRWVLRTAFPMMDDAA